MTVFFEHETMKQNFFPAILENFFFAVFEIYRKTKVLEQRAYVDKMDAGT